MLILLKSASLEFVWSRSRCTYFKDMESLQTYWSKNLNKVKKKGFDINHILMLDDTPEKLSKHYGNLIRITPFVGNQEDNELLLLQQFLFDLKGLETVRHTEKRAWQRAYSLDK